MEKFFSLAGYSPSGVSKELQMLGCSYECEIINQVLRMQIVQEFENKEAGSFRDVQYQIPIKQDTCLEKFSIIYNGQTINGLVTEKEEAKQQFEQMTSEGQTALHAEKSEDGEKIEIKMGNVAANDKITINILFSSIVKLVFSQYFYLQIPLIEKDMKEAFDFLKLKLICTGNITKAECISHKIKVEQKEPNEASLLMTGKHMNGSKMFFEFIYSFEGMYEPSVIFGEIQNSDETTAMELEKKNEMEEEEEEEMEIQKVSTKQSYFISFTPDFGQEDNKEILDQHIQKQIKKGTQVLTDEFVQEIEKKIINTQENNRGQYFFLLDRSGSMCSIFDKARDTLIEFLKTLPDDSYFNVISFGTKYDFLFKDAQKKTATSMKEATAKISTYKADMGGTVIYDPLKDLFNRKNVDDLYQMQIFLLTDGGVDNQNAVVNLIRNNSHKARVHCIGIGNYVDKVLLRRCSESGRGANKLVENISQLSAVVVSVLENSFTPSFTKFSVKCEDTIIESTYPSITEFPSVLKNEQFFMHIFMKEGQSLDDLRSQYKKINVKYYNCLKKKNEKVDIVLQSRDQFLQDENLKKSIFLIGKQLQLNRICSKDFLSKEEQASVVSESIKYQLVTPLTSYISQMQGLTDERTIEYEEYKKEYPQSTQSSHVTPYRSSGAVSTRFKANKKKQTKSNKKHNTRRSAPCSGVAIGKKIKKTKPSSASSPQVQKVEKHEKLTWVFSNLWFNEQDILKTILNSFEIGQLWAFDSDVLLELVETNSKLQEIIGYFQSVGISKDLLTSIIFVLILQGTKVTMKNANWVLSLGKELVEQHIKKTYITYKTAVNSIKKFIKITHY